MDAKAIAVSLDERSKGYKEYPMTDKREDSPNILQFKTADGKIETVEITQSRGYRIVKRFFDIVLSLIALIVLSPVFLVTAIAIRLEDGEPVIFTQDRSGLDGSVFKMYKFRSMVKNAPELHKELLAQNELDGPAFKMKDDPRITKVGKFIRKTSIDELPQLVNIIKGDMSIVGPRPLPYNYLPWFKDEERVRHKVRGGLTGLAQVNGRNTAKWEKRFKYDKDYVENLSFLMDIKILFKTIKVVFEHKDIGARGVDAPPDFHVYRSGLTEKELLERGKSSEAKKTINAQR